MDIRIHEDNRSTYDLNAKRPPLRHIVMKLSKNQRIRKAVRKKKDYVTYKGTTIRL